MKAQDLDNKFDNNEEMIEFLDLSTAHRPGRIKAASPRTPEKSARDIKEIPFVANKPD